MGGLEPRRRGDRRGQRTRRLPRDAEQQRAGQRAGIPTALERYGDLRRRRTAGIQAGSRRNATIYHLGAPLSWGRNLVMRAGLGMGSTMDGLYSYDALAAAGEH